MTIVGLVACLPSAWAQDLIPVERKLNNWLTLDQIKERVSADLPRGTSLAEIDRYFSDNRVEHSYHKKTNQVFARIDNIWGGSLLVSKGAQIVMTLTQGKMLDSIEVRPIFTGP